MPSDNSSPTDLARSVVTAKADPEKAQAMVAT